jgi:hypothetical protein
MNSPVVHRSLGQATFSAVSAGVAQRFIRGRPCIPGIQGLPARLCCQGSTFDPGPSLHPERESGRPDGKGEQCLRVRCSSFPKPYNEYLD